MAKDKRTEAQRAFDWGVKGWAFCNQEMLQVKLETGRRLYDALGYVDKERLSVLMRIERAARGEKQL